jgi:hypothetical protein
MIIMDSLSMTQTMKAAGVIDLILEVGVILWLMLLLSYFMI